MFKALSDETRLRMLSLLLDGEMCVCEIEDCLGLTQSNASRHLNALKNAGLLSSSRHAQWTYFRLNEQFSQENQELIGYLSEKVKALPTYETDHQKKKKCEQADLCGKKERIAMSKEKGAGIGFFEKYLSLWGAAVHGRRVLIGRFLPVSRDSSAVRVRHVSIPIAILIWL
jgi:ArsR family transcriptional regulator